MKTKLISLLVIFISLSLSAQISFQEQIISTEANGAASVYAADIDGDGDMDVLSASWNDKKIAWYENDGQGLFGVQQIISINANGSSIIPLQN